MALAVQADGGRVRARAAIRVSHIQADKKREISQNNDDVDADATEDVYASKGILSPGLQRDKARQYCALKDWEFDEESSWRARDLDVSGWKRPWRSRPGMMEHYEAAKRGEYNVLIFYKMSRLGRNLRESLDLIDAFQAVGVRMAFISDEVDATTAAGKLMRSIMLAFAEMQSEEISDYIYDSIIKRAKSSAQAIADGRPDDVSLPHMALPVWLHRVDGVILPHGPTVEAIRRLIHLRVTGAGGQTTITRRLNEEGFRTPNGKLFRPDKVWKYLQDAWIDRMLGTALINDCLPKGDPERVEIPGYYPAIISEEEAKQLRHVEATYRKNPLPCATGQTGNTWNINKAKRTNTHLSADTDYLVSGISYCTCGERMVARDKGGKRHAYECAMWRTNPTPHESGTEINSDAMHDAVLRVVRHFLQHPPAPEKPARKVVRAQGRSLVDVDDEIARLLKLYTQGRVQESDYDKQYKSLANEREAIQLADRADAQPTAMDAIKALSASASAGLPTREELRQLMLLLVERVDGNITTGETIPKSGGLRRFVRVTLKYPDAHGKRVFMAPLYEARYRQERIIVPIA